AAEPLLAYWRERLAGLPDDLDLPADRPRPPAPSHRGGQRAARLSPDLALRLRTLAREERTPLFPVLLAAFAVLLHSHGAGAALAIGAPVAGRDRAEVEGLIGFFVNTLVMRLDLAGNPSFRALLAQTHKIADGAQAHQELPFDRLVAQLAPERALAANPLFRV